MATATTCRAVQLLLNRHYTHRGSMSVTACYRQLTIAASRTRLWLASGWVYRRRRLSRARENLCKRQERGLERHRARRERSHRVARAPPPANLRRSVSPPFPRSVPEGGNQCPCQPATHSPAPCPDAPARPSSSSRRCPGGREFSGTRRRLLCPVRLKGTPRRGCRCDKGRKDC